MRTARRTSASASGGESNGGNAGVGGSSSARAPKGSGAWMFGSLALFGLMYVATLSTGGLHAPPESSSMTPPQTAAPEGAMSAPSSASSSVDDAVASLAAPMGIFDSNAPNLHAATMPLPQERVLKEETLPRPAEMTAMEKKAAAVAAAAQAVNKFKRSAGEMPPASAWKSASAVTQAKGIASPGGALPEMSSSVGGSWVPPPSQVNFGPSNPRKKPRPPLKPQAEGFLRARKATWERGEVQLTAPMPDKYKPELTAKPRPMGTRPPYSLNEPLWPTPHNPSADAVLALAVNYRIIDYVRFVGSLRRTGYTGDIVLAVSAKMDGDSRRFLQAMDVIAYPVNFNCSNAKTGKKESVKQSLECDWHVQQDVPLPLAIIRHELYLSWAWLYSKQSRLLILDFRDTFFQRDPFESLSLGRPGEPMQQLLVLEHWPYKRMSNCPWNSGWIRSCWREDFNRLMTNHPVLCSGSYFATRDGMIDMETELLNEVRSAKCHRKGVPSDQGYVNYLYWVGRLPLATAEIRGDGIVNTVGALMGKNHGGSIGPLTTWFRIVDSEGFVMDNDNKTRSAVVHQWDRFFDELYWTVDAVLECDGCYSSKHGHGTYSCGCFKHGCKCKEGPKELQLQ